MKLELVIFGTTIFLIANAYHNGKYIAILKSWKKYYQMAFYGFLGLSLYVFIKRHPGESHSLIKHANGIIKYMPIDKDTTDFLTPVFDFTGRSLGDYQSAGERRIKTSGGLTTGVAGSSVADSSVAGSSAAGSSAGSAGVAGSGATKRYVASQQNWRCKDCSEQLTAWFEVHHKTPLEHGGSNHIDNLVALCRNCHGAHTALDNL
jgi:hypothetical protein